MIIYRIIKHLDDYKIFNNGLFMISAQRKSHFLGDKVLFFNDRGEEIMRSKQCYFLFWDFGHKVYFNKEGLVAQISTKWGVTSAKFGKDVFQIFYSSFGIKDQLILNGEVEGGYKVIHSSLSSFEHTISCKSESTCLMFAVMDIALDWFDVN